jgi:hypothetical protein
VKGRDPCPIIGGTAPGACTDVSNSLNPGNGGDGVRIERGSHGNLIGGAAIAQPGPESALLDRHLGVVWDQRYWFLVARSRRKDWFEGDDGVQDVAR